MSFKLTPTSNNPNPIKFKKEIEILEETTSFGQYNNNNYPIPFKKEPIDQNNTVNYSHSNNERIKQLESENESLIFKINDLNMTIIIQSNEITDLKLRLNKYEPESNHYMITSEQGNDSVRNEDETSENYQSEGTILDAETNHLISTCKSDTDSDSDQSDDEASSKVTNIIFNFFKYL